MSVPFQLILLALFAGMPAKSQTVPVGGPVSGMLYDSASRSIRPLIGFPGSSYLGSPTLGELDGAFVAPNGDSALVVQDGNWSLVQGLKEGNLARSLVSELSGPLGAASWASNGTLIVHSPAMRRLMRVDTGSSSPAPGAIIDLSNIPGEVVRIATNDDASQTVIGIRHPSHGGLYAVSGGAPVLVLRAPKSPGPAGFSPEGSVLHAIDNATRRLVRFPGGVHNAPEPLFFSGEPEPLADPLDFAFSADGQHIFLAGGSDRVVREYDLRSRTLLLEIPLDFTPAGLSPVARMYSVFVLSTRVTREQPVWLLDTRNRRSVSFVPASE